MVDVSALHIHNRPTVGGLAKGARVLTIYTERAFAFLGNACIACGYRALLAYSQPQAILNLVLIESPFALIRVTGRHALRNIYHIYSCLCRGHINTPFTITIWDRGK